MSSHRATTPSLEQTPSATPNLQAVQAVLGENMRKLFGSEGFDASKLQGMGMESKLQLLKQMGETMQTLQKMVSLLNGGREMPGVGSAAGGGGEVPSPSGAGSGGPLSAESLGSAMGEAVGGKIGEAFGGSPFGKALGDMLGKAVGDKLAQALGGKDRDSLQDKFAEALQDLRQQQKSTKRDMAQVLSDAADKLKGLLLRPQGSETQETAQKLGEILGEASKKVQELTEQNPVQKLSETILKLLEAGPQPQGTPGP